MLLKLSKVKPVAPTPINIKSSDIKFEPITSMILYVLVGDNLPWKKC